MMRSATRRMYLKGHRARSLPKQFVLCIALLISGACMPMLLGCSPEHRQEPPKSGSFERLAAGEIPNFQDDMDAESLRSAIERSIAYYDRVPGDRKFSLGITEITVDVLKASLVLFLDLMDRNRLDQNSIAQSFDIYSVPEQASTSHPLVTGYFEPILDGRLEPDEEFCYPLYGMPPDLMTVELASFDSGRFSGERLVGRVDGKQVVRYYSRAEIDGEKKLSRLDCSLAWLRDPVDAFFLHIQGSGMIRLPGGQFRRLGYAGTNGRPYRSIGRDLLDMGAILPEDMSLQTIRAYLSGHPEVRDEIMWRNESYVFFRWVQEGPLGSLNVPLTAGRSIATDAKYHPRGGLAFLVSEKPRLNENGEVLGWEPLQRWVLNQDAGGAIKGVGRVDLFCGSGGAAEQIAGRLKHPGKLYFLVKK